MTAKPDYHPGKRLAQYHADLRARVGDEVFDRIQQSRALGESPRPLTDAQKVLLCGLVLRISDLRDVDPDRSRSRPRLQGIDSRLFVDGTNRMDPDNGGGFINVRRDDPDRPEVGAAVAAAVLDRAHRHRAVLTDRVCGTNLDGSSLRG